MRCAIRCATLFLVLGHLPSALVPRATAQPAAPKANAAPKAPQVTRAPSPETGSIAPPVDPKKVQIVAVVNSEEITREELGKQCLWRHGREVLEAVVNKRIIEHECKRNNVVITIADVDAEIDRMAQRFGMPTPQWLKLLETERKIKQAQYAKDIIWPTLALQRLAANRLVVSEQDLHEAWEMKFGEAIQARLISVATRDEAERIRALAIKNPNDFGNLAKQYSNDKSSASLKGVIQPIRKHLGNKEIERVAFALQPGQVSEVLKIGDQFIILQCEKRFEPQNVPLEGQTRTLLEQAIRDKKLRLAADDILRELQAKSVVDIVYDDPKRRAQNPSTAAVVDGEFITIGQLAEECIDRHGEKVLEHLIHRKLVEQVCKKQNIQITPQEVEAEIALAAYNSGRITPDNKPDVAAWMKTVTDAGLTKELYIYDTIWPTLALKKLVGKNVQVTDIDLQRGFEANYGPRVRCRAIVLSSMRRAQEVWELASKNPTVENFGQLAEKYSVEPSTRALRGEIPPIQKWSGEPTLQQEAFSLHPGELSGVVQVGDNYLILLCEGMTEQAKVNFSEVRDLIYEDIFDKKQHLAMSREFDRITEASQIDNYLAGTAHLPGGRKNRDSTPIDKEIRDATKGLAALPDQQRGGGTIRAGSVLKTVPATGIAPAGATAPAGAQRIPATINLPPAPTSPAAGS